MSFIVPVIQNSRQGLCYLNLSGMVANHVLIFTMFGAAALLKQHKTRASLNSGILNAYTTGFASELEKHWGSQTSFRMLKTSQIL